MTRAALYASVSTKKQGEDGTSRPSWAIFGIMLWWLPGMARWMKWSNTWTLGFPAEKTAMGGTWG
jgi:hypothetical protein